MRNILLSNVCSHRLPGLLASVVMLSLSGVMSAHAQTGAAQPAEKPTFRGLESCVLCHNQKLENANRLLPLSRDFCALDEVDVFSHDKHLQGFELLKGELGQRMQTLLSKAANDPDYKVTTDKRCLSCHSDWRWKDGSERPPTFEFGVTCEACHGPSSLWVTPHLDSAWRAVSPREKEEKFGFVDVRNPVRRTQQCYACHIGNVKEGKVVTHEMYAAGHPPLPSIEVESFADQMPTHWRSLREKGEFAGREKYIELNYPGQQPLTDLPRTRSVLIGGVMAMREAVNLLASQSIDNDSRDWPELAVFDCTACHHDLAVPGWRQKRGYGASIPGRPQMFAWPASLVRVAIEHRAAGDAAKLKADLDQFHAKSDALKKALDRRPFGEPKALTSAVHGEAGLVAWLDQLAQDVLTSRVQDAEARRTLKAIVSVPADEYPDFHSARQLMWAARIIQTELRTPYPEFKPLPQGETKKASIDRALENLTLHTHWKSGPRTEAEKSVDEILARLELSSKLHLKLPAGDKSVIAQELPESLKTAAAYDPAWFRAQLDKLSKELDATPKP